MKRLDLCLDLRFKVMNLKRPDQRCNGVRGDGDVGT